jgi:hypothetical protein
VITNCSEFCDDGDITLLLDTGVTIHFPDIQSHNTSNTPRNDSAWYNTNYVPLEWHSTFYASNSCGGGIFFNITTIDANGEELYYSGWDYGTDTGLPAPVPKALPATILLYSNTTLGGGNFTFFDNKPWSAAGGLEPAGEHSKISYSTEMFVYA